MRETAEERDAHMRKIPGSVEKWAEKLFRTQGYIYYRNSGRFVTCWCGACGAAYEGVTKRREGFEGYAEHFISKPVHNGFAVCEKCGKKTEYKAAGLAKKADIEEHDYIVGQRMGEEFVFRVFRITQVKRFTDGLILPEWKTVYTTTEYARVFPRKGKKAQRDFMLYAYYSGKYKWCSHNVGYGANVSIPAGAAVWPGTYREIRNTEMFRYAPDHGKYNIILYYSAFARYRDMEMMIRLKAKGIVKAMVNEYPRLNLNPKGKTPADRLRINKNRCRDLIRQEGNTSALRIYQLEKKIGKNWSDEELVAVERIRTWMLDGDGKVIGEILKCCSPVKLSRWIEKLGPRYRSDAVEYIDYIRMRMEAGYDLSNGIILFPKDIHRRHNEMVLETENEKISSRAKEVMEKFPDIGKRYKALSEKYSAAAGGLIIRPAKDAAEIVAEGRMQHHCVGGDMYLGRHNRGQSAILLLRKAEDPAMPYITVEIKGNEVCQWFGAYDEKKDQELIDAWLAAYTDELKKREKKQKTKKTLQKTA